MRAHFPSLLALAVVSLVVWAAPAQADTIRLTDGTVIHGRVVEYEDGQFVIQLDASRRTRLGRGERITVSAGAVQRIEFSDEEPETEAPDQEGRAGVTLYVDEDFRGRSEVLHKSDPDLRDNTVGNDSVTAIRVPRGYRVTLYADVNYGGRSVELSEDESNLGRTTLGNDTLSSIRIEWVGMGWGR